MGDSVNVNVFRCSGGGEERRLDRFIWASSTTIVYRFRIQKLFKVLPLLKDK